MNEHTLSQFKRIKTNIYIFVKNQIQSLCVTDIFFPEKVCETLPDIQLQKKKLDCARLTQISELSNSASPVYFCDPTSRTHASLMLKLIHYCYTSVKTKLIACV